jgi:hypothetical protein
MAKSFDIATRTMKPVGIRGPILPESLRRAVSIAKEKAQVTRKSSVRIRRFPSGHYGEGTKMGLFDFPANALL